MQGYYVLVCSASGALGRAEKHNFNPPGAAQSTAFLWSVNYLSDRWQTQNVRQPRVTYQSLITRVRRQPTAGTWTTEEQCFVRLTAQVQGVQLNGIVHCVLSHKTSSSKHCDIPGVYTLLTAESASSHTIITMSNTCRLMRMVIMVRTAATTLIWIDVFFSTCIKRGDGRWEGSFYQDAHENI